MTRIIKNEHPVHLANLLAAIGEIGRERHSVKQQNQLRELDRETRSEAIQTEAIQYRLIATLAEYAVDWSILGGIHQIYLIEHLCGCNELYEILQADDHLGGAAIHQMILRHIAQQTTEACPECCRFNRSVPQEERLQNIEVGLSLAPIQGTSDKQIAYARCVRATAIDTLRKSRNEGFKFFFARESKYKASRAADLDRHFRVIEALSKEADAKWILDNLRSINYYAPSIIDKVAVRLGDPSLRNEFYREVMVDANTIA